MKLSLYAVGKLKDAPYRELEGHYLKLLKRYAPFEIVEVRDEKLGAKKLSGAQRAQTIEKEGARLLEKLPAQARTVALCVEGKKRSSEELARWLEARLPEGRELAFIIGGPLGLDEAVTQGAAEKLSLGPLTLPHQLARIVLLEQLYRAWTIVRGESYHY